MNKLSQGLPASAVVFVLLTVYWVFSETTPVQAGSVRGYAHAARTWKGGAIFSNDDLDSATLASGSSISGSAFQLNGGSASFSIDPISGSGSVFGSSVPVVYEKYIVDSLGSQVDGYMYLLDSFTIQGPIPDDFGIGLIDVSYSGSLFPNTDFESHFPSFSTATASFHMTTGYLDAQGRFVGGGSTSPTKTFKSRGSNGVQLNGFQDLAQDAFFIVDEYRTVGVELLIGGAGYNGGGFALQGSGLVGESAGFSDGDVLAEASSLEKSFFGISITLPPGLTISGHSPFIRQVTIPEPASVTLFGIGLIAAASRWRLRRRLCSPRRQSQLESED